ncbi:MAG: carboxypeptidase-like regulatory domain-containing protein [Acidobacteriia bacterium]|nr:carboxypeptidase-like regulatory domain-containing protein [Terriglobia bacterium]
MRSLVGLGLALLACALAAPAQDITGSISGIVMDSTGAAVPNAKVTVTETNRNQVVRTLTTGPDGAYSASLLPVGAYSLKIEAPGFQAQTREGIQVNANDKLKINPTLAVGNVSEVVNVQEAPVAVDLGSMTAANDITGTQVRELSISTRNYESLVALMPGVTSGNVDQLYIGNSLPSGLANVIPFSINGQRNSANNWTVDGADNVDRGSNLTLLNYPSIDAITEFKVLRSLYTADSGRAGGGQINVITKSGTSQFHGDAYEFVRNDAFAANNSINNMNRVNVGPDGKARVPPLRYNDFGYTFGGPIYIPNHYNKDRNKTFFFWSQEFNRVITYTTFVATVPNASEKQGIFSAPVCVAATGSTCTQTASQITNINPIAQAYLNAIFSKIPDGNAATDSLTTPLRNIYNRTQELARIDHTFSDKFTIFGRFLYDSIPTTEPGGFGTGSPVPNVATTSTNSPGRSLAIHGTYSLRPTLLNEAGFDYSYGALLSTPVGLAAKANSPDINPALAFTNTLGVIPELSFAGVGSAVLGFGPYADYSHNYNFFDTLSWAKGRHSLKFGVTLNRYQKYENSPNGNNYGTFSFATTPRPTGTGAFQQAWANFLLGNVGTFTQSSRDLTADVRAWQAEGFAQDDLKVSSRLTLYLGLRYSYFGQPIDAKNELTNFDAASYNPAAAPQINPATGNLVPGTGQPVTGTPAGSPTVWPGVIINNVNSPYGSKIANDNHANFAPRVGVAWDPFGTGKTSIRAGYGIYYDSGLFGTYEQNIFTNPPYVQSINITNTTFQNPTGGTANVSLSPLSIHGTPLPNLTPYTQQWSFDIQRQIGNSFLLDAGYYGSKGTHLLGIIDLNQAYPGVAYAAGLHSGPGTVFTNTDDNRINAVKPYLGYNAINVVEPWFNSNYHSLQVSANKQFGANSLIQASYTWSKNLTDNSSDRSNAPQNSYNFHEGEYGPAQYDRTHVFVANYVYDIPVARHAKGALAYAFQGWELSGIVSYGTGIPTTAFTSGLDPAGLGLLGPSAASARPDMVCDPNKNAPHLVSQWFNTACFQPVPDGQIRPGNEGRFVIRMPGYERWDISLFKNFQFTERWKLQLRGESFNAFNHANPSAFGSTTTTSRLFGTISGFRDPRIIQLAGKLYW